MTSKIDPRGLATTPGTYGFTAFVHSDSWAISTDGYPQLGGYFETLNDLLTALNDWGLIGWMIPNISVSWEEFDPGTGKVMGYRIRNGGAPIVMGSGASVVVAVKPGAQPLMDGLDGNH